MVFDTPRLLVLLLFMTTVAPPTVATGTRMGANPIRRVVTMLQMMQKKVQEEGKKEKQLFDKYMCYCDTTSDALKQSIEAAETKVPQLESSIKEGKAEVDRLKGDVEQAKSDRKDATESLAQGKAMHEKEMGALKKEIEQNKANIAALKKAIVALEKGRESSFLQTTSASQLRQLTVQLELSTADRDLISAFLSDDQTEGDSKPGSGEILGILKQMSDEMQDSTKKAEASVKSQSAEFEAMAKAKGEQIAALGKQIEAKSARVGELGVDLVNLQADYDDTAKGLLEDQKFMANLQKACETKRKEWGEREKIRGEEMMAISSTIKVLNDDETLTLFKKTLPVPQAFFLQVSQHSKRDDVRDKAIRAIRDGQRRGHGQHASRLELVAVALHAKHTSFNKVVKMIDEMVALLIQEQKDDEKKKEYCKKEMGSTEDQIKEMKSDISDLSKAVEEGNTKMASITEEIMALGKGITALDKQVAELTTQRKAENAEFAEKLSMNAATKELLDMAKNLLNKFYNPKLYEEDKNKKESFAEVDTPFGEAFAQVSMRARKSGQLPGNAPEADFGGSYDKKKGGSASVLSMIDTLMDEVTKDMSESQAEEKKAQEVYEKAMEEAAAKRAIDARQVGEKEAVKAELENRLHKMNQEHKAKVNQEISVKKYMKALHEQCDWLLKNFDVRMEARTTEIKALRDAKAVLSGADYKAMVQK